MIHLLFDRSHKRLGMARFVAHTQRRITVGRTPSGRVISSSQRPLPDNKQHSQQTNVHDPGGIRTHKHSGRVTEDLHKGEVALNV